MGQTPSGFAVIIPKQFERFLSKLVWRETFSHNLGELKVIHEEGFLTIESQHKSFFLFLFHMVIGCHNHKFLPIFPHSIHIQFNPPQLTLASSKQRLIEFNPIRINYSFFPLQSYSKLLKIEVYCSQIAKCFRYSTIIAAWYLVLEVLKIVIWYFSIINANALSKA